MSGREMTSNTEIFEDLVARDAIRVRRGALFDTPPPALDGVAWERLEGMMLGLAIGDALGNTSEGQLPSRRRAAHGEVRDFVPNRDAGGAAVGLQSDDSQMAFWALEQMVEDGRYLPERLAEKFCSSHIFGIGSNVQQFVDNVRSGMPWDQAGPQSAGNGALMRIAPSLFPHVRNPSPELWADAALSTMTTHNDAAAICSSVAFVGMLWDLLSMPSPPEPEWWLNRFVELASDLDNGARYSPRGGSYVSYAGPFTAFVGEVVRDAWRSNLDTLPALNRWYSGAFLMETVPSVLYILMRHGHDAEEAIVRAVNDTKDNDTIGAIVGAAVGALHGTPALPARWRDGLVGRTRGDDDGRMFELLRQAKAAFFDAPGG